MATRRPYRTLDDDNLATLAGRKRLFDESLLGNFYRTYSLEGIVNPFSNPDFYLLGPDDTLGDFQPHQQLCDVDISFDNSDLSQSFYFFKKDAIVGAFIFLRYSDHPWFLDQTDAYGRLMWSFFLNEIPLSFAQARAISVFNQDEDVKLHASLIGQLTQLSWPANKPMTLAINYSNTPTGVNLFVANQQRLMFKLDQGEVEGV